MPKRQKKSNPHPKITGEKLAEFYGLTIYGKLKKPKKQYGKHRIWIQVRQSEPKAFRMSECLAYARAVDVLFVQG